MSCYCLFAFESVVFVSCSYEPSQADVSIFESLGSQPAAQFYHAVRWYRHINSYGTDMTR